MSQSAKLCGCLRLIDKLMPLLLLLLTSLYSFSPLNAASKPTPISTQANFLIISDIHLQAESKHTMVLAPRNKTPQNDLDLPTFKRLMTITTQQIQRGVIPKPHFILCLGDMVGHRRETNHAVLISEQQVFTTLSQAFPHIPIFYIYGNNDAIDINYGPFHAKQATLSLTTPLDIAKSTSHWSADFLSTGLHCDTRKKQYPCLIESNKQNGYYAAYIEPHFRLIGLNTVLFSPHRQATSTKAVKTQLDWLAQQLQQAEKQHDSVLLAGHIPPGKNVYDNTAFWMPEDMQAFLHIISPHHTRIQGFLAGHTHANEYKTIYDQHQKYLTQVYLTPALSTSHGNAASIRSMSYQQINHVWQLTNDHVFYFSQTKTSIILKKLYDYQKDICHHRYSTIQACLSFMTLEKIKQYFNAGNPNLDTGLNFPQNLSVQ